MKIRNGFVSNSSSSSFVIDNKPKINANGDIFYTVRIPPFGKTPKNNDGRVTCYWCGEPTKSLDTGFSAADMRVCSKCKK